MPPASPPLLMASLLLSLGCAAEEPARVAGGDGAAIFAEKCAVCHDLPILDSLRAQNRGRPPGFVYDALTHGNMRRVGGELDEASRRAVAEFFTGVSFASSASARSFEVSPRCPVERRRFDWSDAAYPSWGRDLRNLRSLPEGRGLARDEIARLAVKWVVAFPEASQLRSQATAAGGALFVGSHDGSVYALDQETGCTRWHFKAATEVRSAVTIDVERRGAAQPLVRAVFGDRAANVYALDAETGERLWSRSVDPHPNAAITGSISAHEGRLYVPLSSNDDVNAMDPRQPCCTHSGSVVALDARTGETVWRTPTIAQEPRITGRTAVGTAIWGPSGASIWNTPTIDAERGLLFVGTGNNHSRPATATSDAILALELATGRIAWAHQAPADDVWNAACSFGSGASCPEPEGPDVDFGGTTLLVGLGGRDLLVAGQKSGVVHALDPSTGALVWKRQIGHGGPEGGIRYGMAARDGRGRVRGRRRRHRLRVGSANRRALLALRHGPPLHDAAGPHDPRWRHPGSGRPDARQRAPLPELGLRAGAAAGKRVDRAGARLAFARAGDRAALLVRRADRGCRRRRRHRSGHRREEVAASVGSDLSRYNRISTG